MFEIKFVWLCLLLKGPVVRPCSAQWPALRVAFRGDAGPGLRIVGSCRQLFTITAALIFSRPKHSQSNFNQSNVLHTHTVTHKQCNRRGPTPAMCNFLATNAQSLTMASRSRSRNSWRSSLSSSTRVPPYSGRRTCGKKIVCEKASDAGRTRTAPCLRLQRTAE